MSKRKGLSLIEILAATAVMTALLVPMLLLYSYSTTTVYRSSNDITATSLAISKMEEIRALPYFKVENILMGLDPDDPARINHPDAVRFVRGPFEPSPRIPDIAEPNFYKSASTMFHRYTYLSYFPIVNPNPNHPEFEKQRKRIRVQVVVYWKDRLSGRVAVDQHLSFDSIIHDENYNPKPEFNIFQNGNG